MVDVEAAGRCVVGEAVDGPEPHAARIAAAHRNRPARIVDGRVTRLIADDGLCRDGGDMVRTINSERVTAELSVTSVGLMSDQSRTFVTLVLLSFPLRGHLSEAVLVDSSDACLADIDKASVSQRPNRPADDLAH